MKVKNIPVFWRFSSVLLVGVLLVGMTGCGGSRAVRSRSSSRYSGAPVRNYVETGTACWYGPKYHGRTTANGEIFNMNAMTAAHRTLPFDTQVRVTNLENQRKVMVRINDRGPFVAGRIIDLSRAAARRLGFENQGLTRVRIESVP